MVVKMMKWRPWPPLLSKKYQVRLVVRRLEGLGFGDSVRADSGKDHGVSVEIRWKGPKIGLGSFRRKVKRDFTKEEAMGRNGVVRWGEEFERVCNLSGYKDNVFHPWEISFTVLNGLNERPRNKAVVVGMATLNLAEFAFQANEKEIELKTPLVVSGNGAEPRPPILQISLSLLELRSSQEQAEPSSPLRSSASRENHSMEKDELSSSALKAGLRKVKILTGLSTIRRAQKACHEEEQSGEEEGDYANPFDSESLDEFEEGESDEGKDDNDDDDESSFRKSFSYNPLANANFAGGDGGGSYYSHSRHKSENEDWVYYNSNRRKLDAGRFMSIDESSTGSVSEPSVSQSSRRSSILPWKKRKMSFRSPKAKGEPLLKKAYGEEGGDDIDFDRRQLSSYNSLSHRRQKKDEKSSAHGSSVSEFGDDSFAVGSWDQTEVKSRDGLMKLETEVFFASIDQRSEKAAGESACTALVAVIAHWFQNNQNLMPIKSQFDTLIQEGSLEWRNLCNNLIYREQFPDKHFDLETVLQAEIRPLSAVPEKSFIGFFHPEGMEGKVDFLHSAMSFDSMWEEISRPGAQCSDEEPPHVYIVSWNDHFFVLRVDSEAYYIIDTLGERLYEGCKQAYILKFDRNTTIRKLPDPTQQIDKKPASDQQQIVSVTALETKNSQAQQINPTDGCSSTAGTVEKEEEVVCRGKEGCKEYIKSFLAAIPIRELQDDVKKGLMPSMPLHCRLQIEFHYTKLQPPPPASPAVELAGAATTVL